MEALKGTRGPAFDRIVFNAAMSDHLLGCQGAEDVQAAIDRAEEAVRSGRALQVLMRYVDMTKKTC